MSTNIELFIPGRLCLIGEHSDWTGGMMRSHNPKIPPGRALVACTEGGIRATACKASKLIVHTIRDGNQTFCEYSMDDRVLEDAAVPYNFFAYAAGTALHMLRRYDVGGIDINIVSVDLMQKKGIGSSAAICSMVARAYNQLYNLKLSIREEMDAAFYGEHLTSSDCGRMDQIVSYGRGVYEMSFDRNKFKIKALKPRKEIYLLFTDLNSQKNTFTILTDLHRAYPFPRSDKHRKVHNLFGETNQKLVGTAIRAVEKGDARTLGMTMSMYQNLFDEYAAPMSPVELAAPTLHELMKDDTVRELTYGAKGTGSQGDGAIQFVCRDRDQRDQLMEYLTFKGFRNHGTVTLGGEI